METKLLELSDFSLASEAIGRLLRRRRPGRAPASFGAAVDGTNGSMNDLRPNPLRIAMAPAGGAPVAE